MRLLAVDFGFSKIGIAVGESRPVAFSARPSIDASGALRKDAQAVDAAARGEEAQLILVGIPYERDETEGKMARICRQLAHHLDALGWNVVLVDESFSSVEAETMMKERGVSQVGRKARVHGEAAIVILERYLNGQETR